MESGALTIDYSAEDIHSFIEGVLTDRIGEAGKKVHTGRSRNDQIALDERLYLRHAIPTLLQITFLSKFYKVINIKANSVLTLKFYKMLHWGRG